MSSLYAGIYWTLPVHRIGFRHLPKDPAEAATVSTTIRYQRALTHRYVVEAEGRLEGHLVGEIAFMDTQPDRATVAVCEALDKIRTAIGGRRVAVIHVAFDERSWRDNRFLVEHLALRGIERVPLTPRPITLDGEYLDPIKHFAKWRRQETAAMRGLRLEACGGVLAALAAHPSGAGRWKIIADHLNTQGIKTRHSRQWTADNVRKLAGRLLPDESQKLN